jgi:hypothetical protein
MPNETCYKDVLLSKISDRYNLSQDERTDLDDYMYMIGGSYWTDLNAPIEKKTKWKQFWQKNRPKLLKAIIVILTLLLSPGMFLFLKKHRI